MLSPFDNEKIYAVIDAVKSGIYWKDLDGKYVGCNKYVLDVLGIASRDDVVGKTDFDLRNLADATTYRKNDLTAIEKGIFEGQETVTLPDGKKAVYWSVRHPLRDSQGRIVGITGNSCNMQTELDKQRAVLNERLKISQIIDVVNASIYWKDEKAEKFSGCNQYVPEMFGLQSKEEVIGKSEYDLLSIEDAQKITKNDQSVLATGHFEGEERFTLPSGEVRTYFTVKNRLLDSEKRMIGIVGASIDITAQKEAESLNLEDHRIQSELEIQRAVLNEQLKISQIIDVVNASIYWRDLNGVFLGCNQYVLDMFGSKEREDIIGKNEYDLLPDEDALRITKIDQSVMENGYYEGEEAFTLPSGENRTYFTIKNRLLDRDQNVIGTVGTSLDITAQKEAERLRLENTHQQAIIVEEEKFRKAADQVAHDIRSPLASLLMIVSACPDIPERERVALREATNRINDIANHLIGRYRKKEILKSAISEEREPILVSPALLQILTEKKYQYQKFQIKFDHHFSQTGNFAWVNIKPSAFKRMLSNIINNAADALEDNAGEITISLDSNGEQVRIAIEDNGKGMSPDLVQKIKDSVPVSEGKAEGHGIGLTQVRDTLQENQGQWEIDSEIGRGTKFILTFPRVKAQDWIAESVQLHDDDTVVILDDDRSIHLAWDFRFEGILKEFPKLKTRHFEHGQEAIDFICAHAQDARKKIFLLADFELLQQKMSGMEVIETTQLNRSILVTSHYLNKKVQQAARKADTKILPKQLAPEVRINVTAASDVSSAIGVETHLKKVDIVFVDDEQYLLDGFKFFASGKIVDTYCDPKEFLNCVEIYRKDTQIMLDQNYSNYLLKGTKLAEQLHGMGFTNLFLLTGESLSDEGAPDYLTVIAKSDLDELTAIINRPK